MGSRFQAPMAMHPLSSEVEILAFSRKAVLGAHPHCWIDGAHKEIMPIMRGRGGSRKTV